MEISEAARHRQYKIPLTVTNRNGATKRRLLDRAFTSIFFSPQITRVNFDVTATDDAEDDDGESVRIVLGFATRRCFARRRRRYHDSNRRQRRSGHRCRATCDSSADSMKPKDAWRIFFRGEWGTVCGRSLSSIPVGDEENRAKDVACKLLGFRRGEEVTGYGQSGVSLADQPIWLDDVRCLASVPAHRVDNPRSMFDCYYAGPGLHNCTHDEDVGLRCLNSGMSTMDFTTGAASGLGCVSDRSR